MTVRRQCTDGHGPHPVISDVITETSSVYRNSIVNMHPPRARICKQKHQSFNHSHVQMSSDIRISNGPTRSECGHTHTDSVCVSVKATRSTIIASCDHLQNSINFIHIRTSANLPARCGYTCALRSIIDYSLKRVGTPKS